MNSVIAKAKAESEPRWLEDMAEAVENHESEKDSCSDCVEQEEAMPWSSPSIHDALSIHD